MDESRLIQDALRLLGGGAETRDATELLTRVYAAYKDVFTPRAVYALFPITKHTPAVTLEGCDIRLEGEHIRRHLEDASAALLNAFTLGVGVDKKVKELSLSRPSESVALNAIASIYAERIADEMLGAERDKLEKEGAKTNFRYCPGYGDLPLSTNIDVARVLNAQKKIGLTVTTEGLLLPRKSIVGIVGVKKDVR